jgi:uncharacterized metal-binding protein YceD (DUF177 family)
MTELLTWDHAVQDIPEAGLSSTRQASAEELARLAAAFELVALNSLSAAYSITAIGAGRYRLNGRLNAEVLQACVVTLEPVTATIDEVLEATFWPEQDVPPPASGELDLDEDLEPEPIVAGHIDVGRIVVECLAATIDPFPRKADAALDRSSAGPSAGAADTSDHPFAALARMKEKS